MKNTKLNINTTTKAFMFLCLVAIFPTSVQAYTVPGCTSKTAPGSGTGSGGNTSGTLATAESGAMDQAEDVACDDAEEVAKGNLPECDEGCVTVADSASCDSANSSVTTSGDGSVPSNKDEWMAACILDEMNGWDHSVTLESATEYCEGTYGMFSWMPFYATADATADATATRQCIKKPKAKNASLRD